MKSNDLLRVILAHAAEVVRNHEVTLNCSRHHTVDRRLAHLLTVLGFYNDSYEIPTTHSELGEILGVRRESISTAVSEYEKNNLIKMSRGRIIITNIGRLENLACECHQELLRLQAKKNSHSYRLLTPNSFVVAVFCAYLSGRAFRPRWAIRKAAKYCNIMVPIKSWLILPSYQNLAVTLASWDQKWCPLLLHL